MIDRRAQMEYLRTLLAHADAAERRVYLQRLARIEHDERCLRSALRVAAALVGLMVVVIPLMTRMTRGLEVGEIGIVSLSHYLVGIWTLVCCVGFLGAWVHSRISMSRWCMECCHFLAALTDLGGTSRHTTLFPSSHSIRH